MSVLVRAELIGAKLHRLRMFIGGIDIGEYERSQEADIDRKTAEIVASQEQLLSLFRIHGELCVRWDGKSRKKSVRRADGVEVGVISESAWRRPSWQR
jgi:hypothetical protein